MEMVDHLSKRTLTQRTRQDWKLYVGLSLFIVGGTAVLVISFGPGLSESLDWFRLWLLGWLVSAGGAAFVIFGIRCPSCNCRVVWSDMKSSSAEEWLEDR